MRLGIFPLLILFLLVLTSAQYLNIGINDFSIFTASSYGTFKSGQPVSLIQTCDNDTSICTSCNITSIRNPNSDIVFRDATMTKGLADFNYSFDNTSMFGIYTVTGSCWDSSSSAIGNWIYHFTIQSANPAEDNTSIFIVFGLLAIGLLIFSLVMRNYIFSILSGFAFLGLGVYGMINGIADITNVYTKMASVIIIGFGIIITIVSSLEFINENSDWGTEESSNKDDED